MLPPAEDHAGDVVIADIGIPPAIIEALPGRYIELVTPEQLRLFVQPRPVDSHKGDYGRLTIVAGSPGKTGAAYLAAMGALRAGAGLVTVATPASCQPTLAALAPEYMTEALAETAGELSEAAVEHVLGLQHDVIACGPGLGRTPAVRAFVRALVERAPVPLVLDADALVAFDDAPDALAGQRRAADRDHAASGRDGAPARRLDRRGAGQPAGCGGPVRDRSRRARGAEGPPHRDRDAHRPCLHQPDRQPGDGHRRHR